MDISMDPPKKKRPAKSDDTELDRVKPRLSNSRPQDEEERHQGSVPELDVQMGSPETQESSDVEFAVPSYPESELGPDMFSNRVHVELDKKVLRLYPWMEDDEKDENSIYSRITLLRSLVRDYYGQLHQKPTDRTDPIRILRKHPWVIPVLNECWRKGSFRTIRLLSEYTVSGDASDLNMTIFSFCLTCFRIQRFYKVPNPTPPLSHLSVCRNLTPAWSFVDHIYSCRALMGSEIRGTSCGRVASHHFNISYQGAKRFCNVLPYCELVWDREVSHG
jgi:hypothetical protein